MKNNILRKVISAARNVAFVLIILFICFVIYTMSQGNTISLFGYRVLRVLTSSMEPTIVENTCIITKEVPTESLKVGDIITFKSEDPAIYGYFNTHRIHEIQIEDGVKKFVTKGDNSSDIDQYPVSEQNVVGIYVRELPGGRLIGQGFVALSDNKVYFAVIIVPLVLCLLSYFWDIMNMVTGRYEEEDEEDDEEDEDESQKEALKEKPEEIELEEKAEKEAIEESTETDALEEKPEEIAIEEKVEKEAIEENVEEIELEEKAEKEAIEESTETSEKK